MLATRKQNRHMACPECDSHNYFSELLGEGSNVTQICKCRDCDTAWVVVYRPSVRRIVEHDNTVWIVENEA